MKKQKKTRSVKAWARIRGPFIYLNTEFLKTKASAKQVGDWGAKIQRVTITWEE